MTRHILVIDDNPSDLLLSSFHIERLGFEPVKAVDGFSAIEQLNVHEYKVIIVDLQMPMMSGIELIKRIRRIEKFKDIPIMVTSARQESRDVMLAVSVGANDYIVKPIDDQIFEEKFFKLVGKDDAWAEYPIPKEHSLAGGFYKKNIDIQSISEVGATVVTDHAWDEGVMMNKLALLLKKLRRIEKAQAEAEHLLEEKSKQLFELNQNLEAQIVERTKELQIATDLAVTANKAKSQFLANMSHEIRTPLNGMLGFIGLLEKSQLSENQREQLGIVSKSSQLLLSIINDVLEFSKIEAGKLTLEKTPFHLKRCVEDIVDVMSHQAYEKGLELPVYLDENIPKKLIGDESRIRQVLLNLLGNAIKFTPTGEVSLSVRKQGINAKGEHEIYFEVKDSGVGISQDKIKTIFIAFEQADISDTRRYGGTGLGLTISKQIVEAYGGALNVDSIEGVGTTFYFTIPFGVSEQEPLEFTTRNFFHMESVAVVISNATVRSNLVDRLIRWNVNVSVYESIDAIDWSSFAETQKNLLVDYYFVSGDSDIYNLEKLVNNGVHVMVIAPPEIKASSLEDFSARRIDLLTKPVKRESLFRSINEKSVTIKETNKNEDSIEQTSPVLNQLNEKFLLVEDNVVNQQVAIAMLEAHGYSADIANNGLEALELFQKNNYSLILMDCQMPIMDGFESTKQLRKLNYNKVIIAMTANALKQTKEKCFEVGMNDFVTKPIDDEQLAAVIKRNLLRLKST